MTGALEASHASRLDVGEIEAAQRRIAGRIRATPLVSSPSLSADVGNPVYLKLEHLQRTGSFKLRGATNAVLRLSEAEQARGVVGVSTGNHGRGLAQAAREAGVRCIICMSSLVPQNKIDGIRALGADVRIVGDSQDEAQVLVDRLVEDEGMIMLPPFDHPDIIAGQGTLGLDVLEALPEAEALLVPVSGGGLISGVALAAKALNPAIRIIGVSMERGAAMYQCLRAGTPVQVAELPTLADSLGGGIGLENRYTFALVRDLVDDFLLVSETQIARAIRYAYWQEKLVFEGSGAVGLAALRAGMVRASGPIAVIVSGCNIDMALHHQIISGEDVDVTAL